MNCKMIAYLFFAIFYFAQLSIAEQVERLRFFCDVDGGVDAADLILSEKLWCQQLAIGSDKYTCSITKKTVTAKGHIKFSKKYEGIKKDAIIFHASAHRADLKEQKCYSCDIDQINQPDTKICNGHYNALDYALHLPSTCAGPGNVFEGGKDYYFDTYLPENLFKNIDNVKLAINGKLIGSPINCKLEVEILNPDKN